jgi:hypothetical protein
LVENIVVVQSSSHYFLKERKIVQKNMHYLFKDKMLGAETNIHALFFCIRFECAAVVMARKTRKHALKTKHK